MLEDLYGATSIKYMRSRNYISMFIWVVVLAGNFALIQYFVTSQFDKVGVEESIHTFRYLLMLDMGGIIVLSVLWWCITNISGMLTAHWRSYFEQNSFACAIVFSLLALIVSISLLFVGEFGIEATNGHVSFLCCPFILPAIFVFLMYFAPPVQIQEMILPGKWWGRFVVAILAALAAMTFFAIDFL